jgi:uncharacterized OB-fold protein
MIKAIGTYLPPWGTASVRVPGRDEDVVTMAVAAGLPLTSLNRELVERVVLISREPPLLEGGNGAALLAGLGLPPSTPVLEQLGGAPAALEAVVSAGPATLVIGADATPAAGAVAVLCGAEGLDLSLVSQLSRSLPVVTRNAQGVTTDYDDPRLLRERGVARSLDGAGLTGKVAFVAGLGDREAGALTEGPMTTFPTRGASAALFALAAAVEGGGGVRILAVEQANVAGADLAGGSAEVIRNEPPPIEPPHLRSNPGSPMSISLAAYERAFEPKLQLRAAKCETCGMLSYPPRFRCLECGSEQPGPLVDLPRDAVVYSVVTVHVPVPGLATPYSLVLAELGDTAVRVLVGLTGAPPGTVAIDDRGRLVFRRVALRSGVPDYGYAFLPGRPSEMAA